MKRLERILISAKTNLRNDDLELIFKNYNTLESLMNDKMRLSLKINLDDSADDLSKLDACLLRDDLKILEFTDEDYPELLREIPDPPRFIFVKGDDSCLYENTLKLAVVGSRKSTNYGKFVIDLMIPKLVQNDVCIVSGLAFGIDGIAHKKAIEYDGKVIAVLGCGVDNIYPKSNSTLYKNVLKNGCIISEYLPWEKPKNYYFPQRNRIISGLSEGVLVVEAASKSGSLITARYAIEQNRDVFAIPGPVNAYLSQGTNKLIQSGAKLVLKTEDVLSEFPLYQKKDIKLNTENIINELSGEEKKVFQLIKDGVSTFDVILDMSGLDASSLNYNLTILTLKGVIDVVGTSYECKL